MTPLQQLNRVGHLIVTLQVQLDLISRDFSNSNYGLAQFKHQQLRQNVQQLKDELHEYVTNYKKVDE